MTNVAHRAKAPLPVRPIVECCGTRTTPYARRDYNLCCSCCRVFDDAGRQINSWAWHRTESGFVAAYPERAYAQRAA